MMDSSGAAARAAGQAPKILCVDDEPNILAALRRLFRAHGYQIRAAASGQDGLKMLEAEAADLVISDMRMPEMNGVQFLERVHARWPGTVRLLLSGDAEIQLVLDAIQRGVIFQYIAKPWDDDSILAAVRKALEGQALRRDDGARRH